MFGFCMIVRPGNRILGESVPSWVHEQLEFAYKDFRDTMVHALKHTL